MRLLRVVYPEYSEGIAMNYFQSFFYMYGKTFFMTI